LKALRIIAPIAVVLLVLPFLPREGVGTKYATSRVSVVETSPAPTVQAPAGIPQSTGIIENAWRNHAAGLLVNESGVVDRILPDDNEGSRHQKFIVRLSSGHTVLIAHNIDVAPRINTLGLGDVIRFQGKFEWNDKGGVVHWTHRNSRDGSPVGYLQHDGVTYQ